MLVINRKNKRYRIDQMFFNYFAQMKNKLFVLLIGCTPDGRNIEQHDILFSIGTQPKDFVSEIIAFWPEAKGKLHVDAWREVNVVDGHEIQIELKEKDHESNNGNKLFFINLGGYKRGEFEEFHYKMLAVAPDKGKAIKKSFQTSFYKHTGFEGGANSHVDDKYGVDVDDAYEITDILSPSLKQKYSITILPAPDAKPDEMHLGYFKLDKL